MICSLSFNDKYDRVTILKSFYIEDLYQTHGFYYPIIYRPKRVFSVR